MFNRKLPLQERFWVRVDKSGDCWLWTGCRDKQGYGRLSFRGRPTLAHRAAFELINGPLAPGTTIDHRCRNTSCVRPEHLRSVTVKQNTENRSRKTWGVSGVRGVTPSANGDKWMGKVTHFGKHYYVGTYNTIAEAEAAVVAKRLELFTHNDVDRMAIK